MKKINKDLRKENDFEKLINQACEKFENKDGKVKKNKKKSEKK